MTRPLRKLSVALVMAACAGCSQPQKAADTVQAPGAAAAALPADAQTRKVVAAADAFLATLDDAQRKAVLFAFTDAAQRSRWSNLPAGIYPRAGLAWGDLRPAQQAALRALLNAVLSPEGVRMLDEQMAADDTLNNGGPPGRTRFGSAFYYVAVLGQPSTAAPWMLQFGGHHLAVNATVVGPRITLSPTLTGGQPLKFVKDGKPVWIVEREVTESLALVGMLTPAQRAKAVRGERMIDLVLGAGQDGRTLQPEGLPGAEMTAAQKAQFVALIEARLDILNPDDVAATMVDVKKNLDQTWFAWWGPTTSGEAAYFRVVGPTLLLEFSPQGLGGDPTQHAHNIYRDPTNEYGAAWAALR